MNKKLLARGRHTVLPLVRDTLVELLLGKISTLVFRATDGSESELRIEDTIRLSRGEHETVLDGSKPGETFNPKELGPLVELLGCEVTDALAEQTGSLRLAFSNQIVLTVTSTTGYEAWHFRNPRPGRLTRDQHAESVSLTGAAGFLV
jgi:hypothetical protein